MADTHARPLQAWEVNRLLAEGVASGEVVPLPLNVFPKEQAPDAFRFLAAGVQPASHFSVPTATPCCLSQGGL